MTTSLMAAVGWSAAANAFSAGQQAARMAWQRVAAHRAQFVVVLGSSWFEQTTLVEGVRSVFPDIPLAGGSTAGELIAEGPKSHSCAVLAVAYEDLAASVGVGQHVEQNPRLAGYQAAQQALRNFPAGRNRSGLLLFGDGLVTGYSEVIRGIQEVLGTSSLVVGGLMADDLRFSSTSQYANGQVLHGAVVGLLLGGSCTLGVGLEHGFAPISKPWQITRARGHILYELDTRPASSVYEEYFGEAALAQFRQAGLSRQLIAYPLGVQTETADQFLLRNVREFGQDGSLVCTGEVSEGALVQLMIGNKELVLEAATHAAQHAIAPLRTVRFAVVLASVARKRLLGREAAVELQRVRQVIGPSVPLIGCYTYGEEAPRGHVFPFGQSSLQTGAILVLAVGE